MPRPTDTPPHLIPTVGTGDLDRLRVGAALFASLGRVTALGHPATQAMLDASLEAPFDVLVEIMGNEARLLPRLTALGIAPNLFISLSTRSAHLWPLAAQVSELLGAQTPIAVHARERIELALQEALGNAILHGNLGLRSIDGTEKVEFDRFVDELEVRLANPSLQERRVSLFSNWDDQTLTIGILDDGEGFIAPDAIPLHTGASGRGILLIRRLADDVEYLDQGRCVRMTFRAEPAL